MTKSTAAETKQESELAAARAFCDWHARANAMPCVIMSLLKEPAPDALIRAGSSDVAMELTQYREQSIHNQLYRLDRELKLALSARLGEVGRHTLPRCTPRLCYRELPGKPYHYTIPQRQLWPTFGDELISLLRAHRKPRGNISPMRIEFRLDAEIGRYVRIDRKRRYVASEAYPILSRHCSGIGLTWHSGHGIGLPASSMSARYGKTDFAEITRSIEAKLSKLPIYRSAAPGKLMWLLIYAEGTTPTSRLVGKGQCTAVVEHLRKILQGRQPNFDAVWWAYETSAAKGPVVFKII